MSWQGDLQALAQGAWLLVAFAFFRTGAMMMMIPAFGERSVPMRVKLALALAFALIIAPAVPFEIPSGRWVLAHILAETTTGILLGLGLRILVIALQTAGSIAAQTTSLSQLLGGTAADPMPALGQILVMAGLALAVTAGLHVRVAEFLIITYEMVPFGHLPDPRMVADWGTAQIARAFALAFALAAPFAIAALLYNLTLGVINRAMPQLMVAFVGAPVITGVSVALLLIAAPVMLQHWLAALNGFLENPLGPPG